MDQPVTSPSDPTLTRATAASVQTEAEDLRLRANDLRRTADRAASNRYAERGAEADEVGRAAELARQDSETARRQAENLREEAQNRVQLAESLVEHAQPGADAREARQQLAHQHAMARAAEERADRLDKAADESWTRADTLHKRAMELEQATNDESVSGHLRGAADKMDTAVDQLEEKARLLTAAEDVDRQAADYEAQGDTLNAEIFRGEAEAVRARAEAIKPKIPEVDQRIIDAADRPWAPEGEPGDGSGAGQPPADGQQPVPPTGPSGPMQPVDPYARTDADADGLSDDFERRLGTNVNDADTDHDGYVDGLEVGVPFYNPRVKEGEDLDPETAALKDASIREWEAERGLEHNADSDDDGVADWIERYGLEKVPNLTPDDVKNNLSPIDDFVESAKSQLGKPYQFGAEVEARQNMGGEAFDSGELVEWAAKQAGVRDMPDGTWKQYRWLHEQGASTTVEDALATKGALVFGFSSDPLAPGGIPSRRYVAISVGDGKNVVEVSERTGAVQVRPADGLYTYGAKIPALHDPQGDLDGDGWTDKEEMQQGGDPSRGMTWSPEDGAYQVEGKAPGTGTDDGTGNGTTDPADPANPTGTTDPTDPVIPGAPVPQDGTDPTAPTTTPDAGNGQSGGAADPLGTDRYPTEDPAGTSEYDDSYDGSYAETRLASYDPGASGAGDGNGSYEPSTGPADPYGATADGNGSYEPSTGSADPYAGTGDGAGSGDTGAGAGESDSYDEPYTDASTYE